MFNFKTIAAAAAVAAATLAVPAQSALIVTFEAPGVTNTTKVFSYVGVETFNSRAPGAGQAFATTFGGSPITGSYSNVQVNVGDVYGGVGGSNYAVTFGPSGSYSVKLTGSPVNYFGYYLQSLDSGNQVQFKKAGVLLYTFNASDIDALLGAGFVNPATNQKNAFLNFMDDSGTFDEVVFNETIPFAGYESDNHTIGFALVPETDSWVMMILGFGALGAVVRRRKNVTVSFA
jgi:hypothetical protein